ncbi:unnamed protein product [Cuscuta campestris]|uniref:Replication protein A 70 kDa DNA-binding subunit B/D first OB fold domain-containing protein n=1 Tax=Cuscuta campestris TaxID=132261 RepID=A0A484K5K9_9ASTE|nr:unnamed protein product [Cuscuta campestris]
MTMFAPIAEINRDKNSWILMLRAIRVYFVPKWAKGGDSMEIVFHDEHGTRIHAHLAREEKEKFETQIIEAAFFFVMLLFIATTVPAQGRKTCKPLGVPGACTGRGDDKEQCNRGCILDGFPAGGQCSSPHGSCECFC